MYENTVFLKSKLISLSTLGIKNLPSFFLSWYMVASFPLEKYILSNEQDFFSFFFLMGSIITFPLLFIIIAFPGSSSLILLKLRLNAV